MVRVLTLVLVLAALVPAAYADETEQTETEPGLVLLPGQGEIKAPRPRLDKRDRLAPGGGLLLSFDVNTDGAVSVQEFEAGLADAFATADASGDGQLTVFEQLDWAEDLPTRDDSLSNPFRFDPNLDRIISYDEFSTVVRNLAEPYRDEVDGSVDLEKLKQSAGERPDNDERPLRRRQRPVDRTQGGDTRP